MYEKEYQRGKFFLKKSWQICRIINPRDFFKSPIYPKYTSPLVGVERSFFPKRSNSAHLKSPKIKPHFLSFLKRVVREKGKGMNFCTILLGISQPLYTRRKVLCKVRRGIMDWKIRDIWRKTVDLDCRLTLSLFYPFCLSFWLLTSLSWTRMLFLVLMFK